MNSWGSEVISGVRSLKSATSYTSTALHTGAGSRYHLLRRPGPWITPWSNGAMNGDAQGSERKGKRIGMYYQRHRKPFCTVILDRVCRFQPGSSVSELHRIASVLPKRSPKQLLAPHPALTRETARSFASVMVGLVGMVTENLVTRDSLQYGGEEALVKKDECEVHQPNHSRVTKECDFISLDMYFRQYYKQRSGDLTAQATQIQQVTSLQPCIDTPVMSFILPSLQ